MPYVVLPIKAISRTSIRHKRLNILWDTATNDLWHALFTTYDKKWFLSQYIPNIADEDLPKWGKQDQKPETLPEGGTLRFFPTYDDVDRITAREKLIENVKPLPWYTDEYIDNADSSVPWVGADTDPFMPWRPGMTEDGQVRFFPDWIRCIEDRPEIVTVGRFLRIMWDYYDATYNVRHATINWGKLTDARIQAWSTLPKPVSVEDLVWATTPDDIERIYLNGPSSCMSHPRHHYGFDHPVRAYGGHGLAVVALPKRMDPTRFSQRALVWPDKKVYSTIYGSGKLKDLLESLGYTKGSFHGAKLAKIVHPEADAMLMPWLDDQIMVMDMGKYLKIHSKMVKVGNVTVSDLAVKTRRRAWSPRATTTGAVQYIHKCAKCGNSRHRQACWHDAKPLCQKCYFEHVPVEQPEEWTMRCCCGLSGHKPRSSFPIVAVTRDRVADIRKGNTSVIQAVIATCCKPRYAESLIRDGYVLVKNPTYKEPHAEPENTPANAPVPTPDGVTDRAELL